MTASIAVVPLPYGVGVVGPIARGRPLPRADALSVTWKRTGKAWGKDSTSPFSTAT